ncbi:hypothetical protein [Jiella marina]|uniref:hypothetical protein n=1 Tax=Jiella sp. LLJ827 TaxID=2917712 RepID=UPI00210088A3|nr:hypothetical protein [Jiella sp. LLJ827]MCQ0987162.1 hypothetical protein [Jiella sp. LLJ827]
MKIAPFGRCVISRVGGKLRRVVPPNYWHHKPYFAALAIWIAETGTLAGGLETTSEIERGTIVAD